jgi:Putative peptidoglycan binding domain
MPGRGCIARAHGDRPRRRLGAPVFDGDDTDDAPDYRASLQALAQERFDDLGTDGAIASADRYFELYGIAPTLAVVRSRLEDEARHRCHAAIDDAALASGPERMTEQSSDGAEAELRRTRELRAELDHDRAHAKLPDLAALGSSNAYYRAAVARLAVLEAKVAAIRALQAHLHCDDLIDDGALDGGYTWRTRTAVEKFQRGAMLLPTGVFDTETREALVRDSRVRDYETALRVLRERVAAAAGLVEDGSASTGPSPVLGHSLDSEGVWHARGAQASANAAPDLIGLATEVAALALGWRDPTTTTASLDALQSSSLVAVALPPAPANHADMQLHVEIDRGDSARRPTLTVFVTTEAGDIALVRWPTTVGGWQRENIGGGSVNRWKPSPKGAAVWRDLFVGPRWLPPASTPDDEQSDLADRRRQPRLSSHRRQSRDPTRGLRARTSRDRPAWRRADVLPAARARTVSRRDRHARLPHRAGSADSRRGPVARVDSKLQNAPP